MTGSNKNSGWLDKPGMVDKLFYGVIILAILTAIPDILSLFDLLYHKHIYTAAEEIPVFYGLYAAIAFLTLLGLAKFVQPFLNRGEDYYD